MVEKAKLDLLENPAEIEITDIMISTDDQPDLPLPVAPEKWAFNKMILIAAPAVVIVCVITGALLFYFTRTNNTAAGIHRGRMAGARAGAPAVVIDKKNSVEVGAVNTPAVVEKARVANAHFKDFIIDLKDKAGNSRILMCDVVFDLSESGINVELESREDIRSLIYQTLTGRNAIVLRSLEERKRLKKELLQEASKVLGEGIVKNIYFTNYVIM
ncbi:MAG: flagellar basal body-associated FliL family protein [Smithella sp.]